MGCGGSWRLGRGCRGSWRLSRGCRGSWRLSKGCKWSCTACRVLGRGAEADDGSAGRPGQWLSCRGCWGRRRLGKGYSWAAGSDVLAGEVDPCAGCGAACRADFDAAKFLTGGCGPESGAPANVGGVGAVSRAGNAAGASGLVAEPAGDVTTAWVLRAGGGGDAGTPSGLVEAAGPTFWLGGTTAGGAGVQDGGGSSVVTDVCVGASCSRETGVRASWGFRVGLDVRVGAVVQAGGGCCGEAGVRGGCGFRSIAASVLTGRCSSPAAKSSSSLNSFRVIW